MLGKTTHLELPRRITAYYLLFGLAAIAWLIVGVVFVSRAVLSSRDDSYCLTSLGAAAETISGSWGDGSLASLQGPLERLCGESPFAYAALSRDDRFIAHSRQDQIGTSAGMPSGALVRWGEVERVRFVDGESQVLREYRTPVRKDGRTVATLHMGIVDSNLWTAIKQSAEYAPVAILGPMLLMTCGAVVLRQMVRPLSGIEGQLRTVAMATSAGAVPLQLVASTGPAALGWNRLVAQRPSPGGANLSTRLGEAVKEFRQRKTDVVLAALPDGVALSGADGKISYANRAMAALLNRPDGELVGHTMAACLELPEDIEALSDQEQLNHTVVVELDRSDESSPTILRIARYPVIDEGMESATGWVWSVRDITQQKFAERTRTQFVTSATHELRTPLANIKAYAETLALNEVLEIEQQKQFCNIINAEATRLARFIDDLLSISSMEVGALSLSRQETDVERMFRDAIEKVRPQMVQKQIDFTTTLPEKLPKLSLDKDKIIATLVNLLGNAAKYTPDGGQVRFKVQSRGDHLQIDVEDTGYGISEEDLPKLFDKFFRSSDPRVQQQTGSGLGLSLAGEVIRLHGGKLNVRSEINKGSVFTITLPLA